MQQKGNGITRGIGKAEKKAHIPAKELGLPKSYDFQQELPKADLDEEVDRFWDSCIKHENEIGGNVIWSNKIEIEALARHFYELGFLDTIFVICNL